MTELPDARRDLIVSWGEQTLLPAYVEFIAQLDLLDQSARKLCRSPAEPVLTRLPPESVLSETRAAWSLARSPWKRAEVFAFGPYSEEPLRLGPKIDTWPLREADVRAVLEGDGELSEAAVARLGTSQSGLTAIEFLLFADDATPGAFDPGGRRCAYLTGLTADVLGHARALHDAWDPAGGDFLGELRDAGRGSELYDTLRMALGELVNRMAFLVEGIRGDKLGRPLGQRSGGVPAPDKVEARFSGRSLEDIRDNLLGLERLFLGVPDEGVPGLEDYLRQRGRSFSGLFSARLADARAALDAIPEPLDHAVSEAPERVQAAIDALGGLQRCLQVDVLNALSLSVTFSDNDGD